MHYLQDYHQCMGCMPAYHLYLYMQYVYLPIIVVTLYPLLISDYYSNTVFRFIFRISCWPSGSCFFVYPSCCSPACWYALIIYINVDVLEIHVLGAFFTTNPWWQKWYVNMFLYMNETEPGTEKYIDVVLLLTAMVGMVLFLAGLFKVGVLVETLLSTLVCILFPSCTYSSRLILILF